MPLPIRLVIEWLDGLGWDGTQETGAPLVRGPYIRSSPDRLATISPTPGPGFLLETAADASCFQARLRGSQDNQDDAEGLAYGLDSLILGALFPAAIDSRVIIHVHRLGAGPSPLTPGPDSAQRYEYTTQYVCIAGT